MQMLEGKFHEGDRIKISRKGDELAFKKA